MPRSLGLGLGGIAFLVVCLRADALIQVLLPLEQIIQKEADYILLAEVEAVDAEKLGAVFVARSGLKGKAPFERIPMSLKGDVKLNHAPELLKRLAPKLPVVMFVRKQQDDKYLMLAYTDGTWFQAVGDPEADRVRWKFNHCEIYLRRTFKGTTEEMRQTVADSLAGKRRPPRPDAKVAPGFGPEIASPK